MSGAVPKLRFPGFAGEWKPARAGDAFAKGTARGEPGLPIFSVTMDRGLVPRDSLDRHMGDDAADGVNLRAEAGDVVYNMMRMWQGAVGVADRACMVSPAYVVLKPRKETSAAFFNHWFENKRMLYKLGAYSHGLTSDRLRLYYDDFALIPLHLPTLPEQEKIAGFLGAVDGKISGLRRKEEGLKRFKAGLMQKLFSQELRFTRDDGSDFPEWEETRLSAVLFEHKGRSDGSEPVFSVSVHKGLVDQIEHLGRSFSAADTSHYNQVLPGDVVYTKSPTGDFAMGIIKQSKIDFPVIVSPLYGVFTPETPWLGRILDEYFASPVNTSNYLAPLVQKGAKNTIAVTNSRFLEGTLTLPRSPDEQRKIAEALSALDGKIAGVRAQIAGLASFKKGLLQQMFV